MTLNHNWGDRLAYKAEDIAEILDRTRWTQDCNWEESIKLSERLLAYQLPAHTNVFTEGASDPYMCFILKGKIGIYKTDAKHQVTKIATVSAPQSLGEMCLIDGKPRSATAKTETEVLMLVLTTDNYLKLAGRSPAVANKLLTKIAQMLSQRLRATSVQLVDYLGEAI